MGAGSYRAATAEAGRSDKEEDDDEPETQGPDSGVPPRYEKQEKGQEKQDEKGRGPDEKYEKNPVGFLMFAVVCSSGWASSSCSETDTSFAETDRGLGVLVWGAAAIVLCGDGHQAAGAALPARPSAGTFVWVAIWAGVGVGLWTGGDWEIVGPIVLIAIALALVVGRLLPRR